MRYLLVIAIIIVLTGCQSVTEVSQEPECIMQSQVIEGQFIVVLNELSSTKNKLNRKEQIETVRNQILQHNKLERRHIKAEFNQTIAGFSANLSPEQVKSLQQDSRIHYIEKDQRFNLTSPCSMANNDKSNKGSDADDEDDTENQDEDNTEGENDNEASSTQITPYGIERVGGGITYNGDNVVWILDTGIDVDHPDLNVDASRGFNSFFYGGDSQDLDDDHGHGTHIAGIIAAKDNNIGVVGVAAGATVIPVKVMDRGGSGSYSGVIAGIEHIAENGKPGDVANISFYGSDSEALDDAVLKAASKGIKFTLAAGNDESHAANGSPARVNGTNIYTISAIDKNDNWASFSNYGNPPIDFAAPGVRITSTWKNGEYHTTSGTSMAAPHAAGILLLGEPKSDGFAKGDVDGNADPIISR